MMETEGGSANCLAPGVHIGEYRLLDVIGEGGFGIVYRARDVSLDRIVAIKEYMPATLAGRKSSNEIHVRSQHRGAFDAGLRSFINEARLLAKFSHPALVHVYRFFEFNGTAYMVMRHYEGQTLRTFLASQQGRINQRTLAAIISPILDVVDMLHAADCYHRDIAPDNVFLQNSGMPVLLDFGAARRIIGDMTQALTMVLKPGFAPIEQYVDDGAMPQGAWTDIYQIGAMLYLAITGKPPATSVARMINDPVVSLDSSSYRGYSAQFLHGVHRALAVNPQDRPQTITELKELLGISTMTSPVVAPWLNDDIPMQRALHSGDSITDAGSAPQRVHAAHTKQSGALGKGSAANETTGLHASFSMETPSEKTRPAPEPPIVSTDETITPIAGLTSESPQQGIATSTNGSTPAVGSIARDFSPQGRTASPDSTVHSAASKTKHKTFSAPSEQKSEERRTSPVRTRWIAVTVVAMAAASAAGWWGTRESPEAQQSATPASSDDQQWLQAQTTGTVAAIDAYLEANPLGKHRSEAMTLINRLEVTEPAVPLQPATPASEPPAASTERATPTEPATKPNGSTAIVIAPPTIAPSDPTLSDKQPSKHVGDTGRVLFRVSPWGRVSVNGVIQGTTPPLTQIELPEGMHRIEVGNPAAATVTRTVQVKKGESVVLSHQFE